MRVQEVQLLLEVLRHPQIIAVEESEKLAPCLVHGTITSAARAAVLLPDVADAFQIRSECALQVNSVGRTVVNDYDLELFKGLSEDRVERLCDVGRDIVGWNDNADGWVRGRSVVLHSVNPPFHGATYF